MFCCSLISQEGSRLPFLFPFRSTRPISQPHAAEILEQFPSLCLKKWIKLKLDEEEGSTVVTAQCLRLEGQRGGGDNLENSSDLCRLGVLEASFLEIPALTCTCVVATFFWLLLTLFIRKLRQVRGSKLIIQELVSHS